MKYTKELPQTNRELAQQLEKSGWIKIKEPKNLPLAVLFSFPFSCILIVIIMYIAYLNWYTFMLCLINAAGSFPQKRRPARKSSILLAALISWRSSLVVFVSILRPLKDI